MTCSEIAALTHDELRVKIAEVCGWTRKWGEKHGRDALIPGLQVAYFSNVRLGIKDRGQPWPDYPNDLNAMHEAEKTLTWEQSIKYRLQLAFNSDGPKAEFLTIEAAMCHATALQRARAFVKTLYLSAT